MPENVQNMILENKISMGHARVLSKLDNDEEISKIAQKVVDENISVRDLEEISTDEHLEKKVPIKRVEHENKYNYIENELRDVLGTKVKVNNGKMEIFFDSESDLIRILDIMDIEIK